MHSIQSKLKYCPHVLHMVSGTVKLLAGLNLFFHQCVVMSGLHRISLA